VAACKGTWGITQSTPDAPAQISGIMTDKEIENELRFLMRVET